MLTQRPPSQIAEVSILKEFEGRNYYHRSTAGVLLALWESTECSTWMDAVGRPTDDALIDMGGAPAAAVEDCTQKVHNT